MGINNKDFSALWPQEDDNSYEDTAEGEDGSEEGRVRVDVGRVSLEAAAADGHPAWFQLFFAALAVAEGARSLVHHPAVQITS